MRDLSFMSFHVTNKCITDSLRRDWNSANKIRWTDTYAVFMMMTMMMTMILGLKCGINCTEIKWVEDALVVANPKEKAREKAREKAKAKAKANANPKKQLKPENASDTDALISDQNGCIKSNFHCIYCKIIKYCKLYV